MKPYKVSLSKDTIFWRPLLLLKVMSTTSTAQAPLFPAASPVEFGPLVGCFSRNEGRLPFPHPLLSHLLVKYLWPAVLVDINRAI